MMSEPKAISFPTLFNVAEKISDENQHRYLFARGSELILLAAAAAFGEIPRTAMSDIGPVIAVISFTAALAIRLSGYGNRAEKRWYDARAAAESIKTATWQYAVGGQMYPMSSESPDIAFRTFLASILKVLPGIDVPADVSSETSITREMADLRNSSRNERVKSYLVHRARDQQSWYSKKAKRNGKSASQWQAALIATEFIAVLLGVLRVSGQFDVNWLGALAAAAAGASAWQQTKDYRSLNEAYSVTSHEIAMIVDQIDDSSTSEETWARFAHDAEAAFSREHTLWLARRQGPLRVQA